MGLLLLFGHPNIQLRVMGVEQTGRLPLLLPLTKLSKTLHRFVSISSRSFQNNPIENHEDRESRFALEPFRWLVKLSTS
jgi:hypothetical protein